MYILIISSLFLAAGPYAPAVQELQIPELTTEAAASVLIFEIEGLEPADLAVERIVALQDRAKVYFRLRGKPHVARFLCRATDFGARWGLEEDVERSINALPVENAEPTVEEEPAAEQPERAVESIPEEAESVLLPQDSGGHRAFLAQFVTALHQGDRDRFSGYFYRDSDFDVTQSEETPAESLARLQRRRRQFEASCDAISGELGQFLEFSVSEIVATGITPAMMNDLRPLMPEVKEFYNTAVVELLLDGRPGNITFEGVALVGGSWRIGGMVSHAFPEPSEQPQD